MTMNASAARWWLGELLGGDEGRALVDQARAALSAEGLVRPDRVMAMFAPVPAEARRIDGNEARLTCFSRRRAGSAGA